MSSGKKILRLTLFVGTLGTLSGSEYLLDDYYTYAYAKKFVNTEPFKFEKPEKLKDKKVYYLYSALGIPKTDKQIIFASNPNTLVVTEYFFIIKDGI